MMATPPVPKPRSDINLRVSAAATEGPVPLPRTNLPANNDKVSASDIFRSIGTVTKQLKEDVSTRVSNANEKLEKSFIDGSKLAKGTLEKTLTTSRAMRDSVTKSVIEGTKTASMKLCRPKKAELPDVTEAQRCMSLPVADVSLFDNIQFYSPMLEQKGDKNESEGGKRGNIDDLSLLSSNSDSNTDSISNFSHDSHDFDGGSLGFNNASLTYDTPKPSRANSIASSASLPDLPERRKKKGNNLEIMRQNSLYENWTLPLSSRSSDDVLETNVTHTAPRPSYSTIYEFDPLNTTNTTSRYEGMSNELLLLKSFLTVDTHGTIVATDHHEDDFEDFGETDYYNPPDPPERFDSLLPEDGKQSVAGALEIRESNSSWYVASEADKIQNADDEVKPRTSKITDLSRRLKLYSIVTKRAKPVVPKIEIVEKPPINDMPVPYYSGTLNRITGQPIDDLFRNSQLRYCVLSDQKLMCYSDPTNGVLKEAYLLDAFYSLQIVLPLASSTTGNTYHFEIMMSSGSMSAAPRKVVFTCESVSERRNWAQMIAEHLTSGFPPKYTAEFSRLGWCYIKEGVTGEWRSAWLILFRRVLCYYTPRDEMVYTIDLRKTSCVTTQEAGEQTKLQCPSDGSPTLIMDCSQRTLYLRFPHERVLNVWCYMIKLSAHNNGAYIHHQQLTKEDVPVIVDKCVSFIYAYGSLSEGIYRRAGSSCTLASLLSMFRRDAWSVQLSVSEHSEHDVAGVLKRFLRDLPETLVPRAQFDSLLLAIELEDETRRHGEYRRIMASLPLVARNTARKLFAHLYFLHTMAHANKMNAENLASVWAPTIMPAAVTSSTVQTAWSAKEVFVVRDLIAHFEAIWEPTEAEKRREATIRRVLLRVMSNSAPSAPKAAGELRAWIYIHDRSTCHQVALSPSKTSADICIELCEKANVDSHLLMLEEVICGESMRRIVHNEEIVLDVVLRWSYWDEDDRKDNYLVVKENGILNEMEALRHSMSLVCGELKIATESSKAFKLHMFEFQNGCLCYFKDKQGSHKIEEWNIRDILWYLGHEPKRNPQSRWAITFIPRNKQKRSKDKPWFGCTIAGAVTEDRLKWMTAMMFAQHHTILPNPRLVIT